MKNQSTNLKDWTLAELKRHKKELDDYINDGCYGRRDLYEMEAVTREINRRESI